MKKTIISLYMPMLLLLGNTGIVFAQKAGDTLRVSGKVYKLQSANLITNPGFESDYTGWTDGTSSAATLTSAKFTMMATGGVNNSKYLVGTTSESVSSAGSIGTGWSISAGKSYLFYFSVKYQDVATAAASEQWLKVSLTNNKTLATEPVVVMAAAQVGAGGQWTQNAALFTNTTYTYAVARFRWLGGRLGFDDFGLYEAYEIPDLVTLNSAISQATALYVAGAVGASDLQAAITKATGFVSSTVPADVRQAISDLQAAIKTYQYANASTANPLDMTSFLVNPGFDGNASTGWTGPGTVNYHEVEFYQKSFNMYQTVSGLPAGKYRLKAKGFERPKGNDAGVAYKAGTEKIYARFYAQTTGFSEIDAPFNSLYKHTFSGTGAVSGYVNTMAGAETMFTNTSVNYYDVTLPDILLNAGGTLTLGARCDTFQTGSWDLFDNFRLEYLGSYGINDLVTAVNALISDSRTMQALMMQQTANEGLNAAVAQAERVLGAIPQVYDSIATAKATLTAALATAQTSVDTYVLLQKTIDKAVRILGFLDKPLEIQKLQAAIDAARLNVVDKSLTLTQINKASIDLKTTTRSVGKQLYIPTWMMGDVNLATNNWSLDRSIETKDWILFWEPGFGSESNADMASCLALAEKCYDFYADSLKFIRKGSSKTDQYKMIIRYRYTTEWEATGSGVDNTIGLLTLTPWALTSRSGQTTAHEVGHCFQYQVHCDNNDSNGWMYGYGDNASGSNGFWEQCAQWQAYKVFPSMQFSNEWFSGYLSTVNKHLLHETPRYNNYFIQDYWCDLHGMDFIGRLWNESKKPEDPIETYIRLNGITLSQFNDEMHRCAARFASWDIPALRSLGASSIASRTQPKVNNVGGYLWRIDSTVCVENFGHNILKMNPTAVAKTVTADFEGLAGSDGFRKNYAANAGWRIGFVALKTDGTRVYGDPVSVTMGTNGGKASVSFDCPASTQYLWFVVSGAPTSYWRHAWDDTDANDEQWPYQVKFGNTNLYGYVNMPVSVTSATEDRTVVYIQGCSLRVENAPEQAQLGLYDLTGTCIRNVRISGTTYSEELQKGIYVVRIVSAQGTVSHKVLVR